jgi:hypothetical protein
MGTTLKVRKRLVIIDAGRILGLRHFTLNGYFRLNYHRTRAAPGERGTIQKDMFENQIEGVTLEEVALAEYEGEKEFLRPDGRKMVFDSRVCRRAWNKTQDSKRIIVETKHWKII